MRVIRIHCYTLLVAFAIGSVCSCTPQKSLPLDYETSVVYHIKKKSVKEIIAVCNKLFSSVQMYDIIEMPAASDVAIVNDSTIQARFNPDDSLDYKVRFRFAHVDSGINMYVSVTENLSITPRLLKVSNERIAKSWAHQVFELLDNK